MEQFINKVIQGDCLEVMKDIPDNSVDSIVTDPPAGISFMGKSWDTDRGGRDNWIKWMSEVATECKRVLKPGGHAFVWTIPRTSHWTANAWENAGFEIRDVVAHIFGSGFPKSLNIGKAVDKLQGNEREEFVRNNGAGTSVSGKKTIYGSGVSKADNDTSEFIDTKGTSEWEGWGTALKPAREDWLLMRKPIEKGLTIAKNCLKYGTGGINIDESRVEHNEPEKHTKRTAQRTGTALEMNTGKSDKWVEGTMASAAPQGRFPANLIHDNSEEVRGCFPETKSGGGLTKRKNKEAMFDFGQGYEREEISDSGNASRFFKSIIYQAKASKSERNKGCEGLEEKIGGGMNGTQDQTLLTGSGNVRNNVMKNNHPTVKPIALMEYLIKMVTPKGGIVLDPFAGSGSTLVAAKQNGYQYIGIELTEEYIPIINARLTQDTNPKE